MPDAGRPLGSAFRKSSFSGGGGCVEVGLSADSSVVMRDTKDPLRSVSLTFTQSEWAAFLDRVKSGELDFVDDSPS